MLDMHGTRKIFLEGDLKNSNLRICRKRQKGLDTTRVYTLGSSNFKRFHKVIQSPNFVGDSTKVIASQTLWASICHLFLSMKNYLRTSNL